MTFSDKITEDADWRDGMSHFRLRVLEELKIINKEIETLKQKVKGDPK
tara:strand:- start:191 stop:334 length:144 start_codon:yes stop_codon:yes gene_type:complete